jgi:tRNA-2-methylthio-N6-dimethylallyladenosine synthase
MGRGGEANEWLSNRIPDLTRELSPILEVLEVRQTSFQPPHHVHPPPIIDRQAGLETMVGHTNIDDHSNRSMGTKAIVFNRVTLYFSQLFVFTLLLSSLWVVSVIEPVSSFQLGSQGIYLSSSISTRNTQLSVTTTTSTTTPSSTASTDLESTTNDDDVISSLSTIFDVNVSNNVNVNSDKWYPTRIQDTMDYDDVVISLFLRHIVTETYDIAQLALQQYMSMDVMSSSPTNENNDDDDEDREVAPRDLGDPFGRLAKTISACNFTRHDGGTIGWIDRPLPVNTHTMSNDDILPNEVLREVYEKRPKAGDMYIIQASSTTKQWHLVQIAELWIQPPPLSSLLKTSSSTSSSSNSNNNNKLGSYMGTNLAFTRKKLKGHGVIPDYARPGDNNDGQSLGRRQQQLQTYTIKTMGCQMNVADSERLEGVLQHQLSLRKIGDDGDDAAAAAAVGSDVPADVVIWNTCSIRDHAEQKVYDAVGPYAARKRRRSGNSNNNNNKHSVLIVTGCVAQQEGEALIKRVPEIDAVIGPQYIPYLPSVLDTILNDGRQVVLTAPNILTHNIQAEQEKKLGRVVIDPVHAAPKSVDVLTDPTTTAMDDSYHHGNDGANSVGWYSEPVRGNTVTAFVNVLYGCNEHCTYCVVPSTRGMEQSRTMESILHECQSLSDAGYKEITLIGQNIDAYGRDMIPKRNFAQLLEFLNNNLHGGSSGTGSDGSDESSSGIERIRYVTSHPRYFTDRVIDAVANLDKVCECFHMPFQAGDNDVLKRMRRGYTYESYMKIINKIRTSAPDAAICADIIVGFPGETDEAFQRTLDLMREVKFDNVNSFAYSPRPNTEAALFDEQIPEDVKSNRLRQVQDLATKHGHERSQRYLGRVEDVLVEDANPRNPSRQVMGRTRQGRQVYFDGDLSHLKGRTVPVKITEARTWSLMGELV